MTDTKEPPKDIAILSGPTEDGLGARVVRIREGGDVSAGEIRPVRDGEPINQSELVRLHPLDASQRVCAVEVLHAPAEEEKRKANGSAGPARVSNARYRQNWSEIFERQAPSDGSGKPSESDWSVN
jgi:3-phenylpropionate/cinnamic acid dioxygenase small subunit